YGFGALTLAGLEKWGLMRVGIPGLDDVVNVLGRGIHFADVVNTVSERYPAEIQRPEFGEGVDEVLRANVHKLYGIVNGIDYEQFDPGRDPNIPHHYSATAPEAKALDRAELRTELGLERVDRPRCARRAGWRTRSRTTTRRLRPAMGSASRPMTPGSSSRRSCARGRRTGITRSAHGSCVAR